MKTTRYIFVAALALLAAACQKENASTPDSGVIINATIDNTETKTVLGEKVGETIPVLWEENDDISVFDGNCNNQRFRTYTEGNHVSATFQFRNGSWADEDSWTSADVYYAIYPGSKGNTYSFSRSGESPVLTMPFEYVQGITPGYDKSYSHIIGVGTSDTYVNDNSKTVIDMKFKSLVALIKFEIIDNSITGVRFLDQNGSILGGSKIDVTFGIDGSITTALSTGANGRKQIFKHEFTSTTSEETTTYTPKSLEPGIYYMAVIPPSQAIKPRLSLTTSTKETAKNSFENADYTIDKKGSKTIELKPGMILDLGKWSSDGIVTE